MFFDAAGCVSVGRKIVHYNANIVNPQQSFICGLLSGLQSVALRPMCGRHETRVLSTLNRLS